MTIELKNVTYGYSRSETPVLKNFSAVFHRGQITALTGENGCGKTTVSKLITGVLRPDEGTVVIGGEDIKGLDLFAVSQKAGYLWQNPNQQLFCATVREEIAFSLRNKGLSEAETERSAQYWLAFFHLEHLADARTHQLSLGEKQRLALACVLSLGASRLVLDEPTGGLDLRSRRILGQLLRELADDGCGVVMISHEKDFIRRWADAEVRICSG